MAAGALEDLLLAERCVEGDREAQRTLFHRERRRVHAALYRILGTNVHMDDLVQEAFLAVFRSLRTFRGEASLGTWIDRCTVRVAYAHLERERRPRLVLVPEPPDLGSVDRQVEAREALRQLYRALDGLPTTQRLAFVLHVVEGRPMAEVARAMESTVVATKVRVWRARREIAARARSLPALSAFLEQP